MTLRYITYTFEDWKVTFSEEGVDLYKSKPGKWEHVYCNSPLRDLANVTEELAVFVIQCFKDLKSS